MDSSSGQTKSWQRRLASRLKDGFHGRGPSPGPDRETSTRSHLRGLLSLHRDTGRSRSPIPTEPAVAEDSTPVVAPPKGKNAARVGLNFTKTLITRLPDFATLDPAQLVSGVIKAVIEVAETVKDNMDAMESRIHSVTLQLEAVQRALKGWTTGDEEKKAIGRFERTLQEEFGKLTRLSQEWLVTKIADHENEKREIADIFERVNEARFQLAIEADLRVLSAARGIDKHVRDARLDRLQPSNMADHTYGLKGTEKQTLRRVICTPGTRVKLLDEIVTWAKGGSELVYWLSGPAGTGKSTVAYTLARRFELATPGDTVVLGANFFCSRHYEELRFSTSIIRTIAYQLALRYKPFADALVEVGDFAAVTKGVQDQLADLLVAPWQKVLEHHSTQANPPPNHLIIIDALDELDSTDGTDFLTTVLPAIAEHHLHGLKFLVTSRPDPELSHHFSDFESRKSFRLQDIAPKDAQADIATYLNESLPHLVGKRQLQQLVALTDGLFIYAATIAIHLRPRTPKEQTKFLEQLFALSTPTIPSPHKTSFRRATYMLDQLYHQLVKEAFKNFESDSEEYQDRLQILHTFMCANEPLSTACVAALLFEHHNDADPITSSTPIAQDVVSGLHSVLYEQDGKVLSYHKSFSDFIFDNERSEEFACNTPHHHRSLTMSCFRVMNSGLRFNIANIPSSFILDSENETLQSQITSNIPPVLRYSCHHWAYHLSSLIPLSPPSSEPLLDTLDEFLSLPTLFWIETMNLLGLAGLCDSMLQGAYEFVALHDLYRAEKFIEAANFAIYFSGSPASLSTPHLYISALATWPRNMAPCAKWRSYFPYIPKFTNPPHAGACLSRFKMEHVVHSVTFSPDGSRLVGGMAEGSIRVMDSSTGRLLLTLEGHNRGVCAIAYSNDGLRIASGSVDATLRLWDAQSGALLRTFGEQGGTVESIAFSPDGVKLVSASRSGRTMVWNLVEGEIAYELSHHTSFVTAVVYSPDGKWVFTGSEDKTVGVWNAGTGVLVKSLEGHSEGVRCAAISTDGTIFVSASRDGIGKVWDLETGDLLIELQLGSATWITSLAFIPQTKKLLSGTADAQVALWDVLTGALTNIFSGHGGFVHSVAVSSNGRRFVSSSEDRTIRIWDAFTGMTTQDLSASHLSAEVTDLVCSGDGQQIVSTGLHGFIRIWDSTTGELVKRLEGPKSGYWSIAMSRDGTRIVAGGNDGSVCVWDVALREMVRRLSDSPTEAVFSIAISDDGTRTFFQDSSNDGEVAVWDLDTGTLLKRFSGHRGFVTSLSLLRGGSRVISASEDGTVQIWDPNKADVDPLVINAHVDPVNSVGLSGDGAQIVSASCDKTLRVWSAQTGDLLRTITGHAGAVYGVDISFDGSRIVSGSDDETVRVWDGFTGEMMKVMEGHNSLVRSVKLLPDATRAVSAGQDGTIRVWNVLPASEPSSILYTYTLERVNGSRTGWLLLPRNEGHLMFVPPDMCPPDISNVLTISASPVPRVDFTEARMGPQWASCYVRKM